MAGRNVEEQDKSSDRRRKDEDYRFFAVTY